MDRQPSLADQRARVESAAAWIHRRANNVRARRALLATCMGAAFVATLLALVLIPLNARRASRALAATIPKQWPDTTGARQTVAATRTRIAQLDTVLAVRRAAARVRPRPPDTLTTQQRERRDSLTRADSALAQALQHVKDAPLPASYRALAEAPELRSLSTIRVLLDSLNRLEKNREGAVAAGGLDPIYIALTTRAAQVGREIAELADRKRAEIRSTIDQLAPPPAPPPRRVDTMPPRRALDSAVVALSHAERALERARAATRDLAQRAERARSVAAVGAPGWAMLGAALVFSAALAFALGLGVELRTPHVSDAQELEAVLGAPVLAMLGEPEHSPEDARRASDREMPRAIERRSTMFRVLNAQVSGGAFELPSLTVTGDHALVVASIAANLAAALDRPARSVLVIDADPYTAGVSRLLMLSAAPGLSEVLAGALEWSEVVRSVIVGRGRTIDVLPAGAASLRWALRGVPVLASALGHLRGRYDSILIVSPAGPKSTVATVWEPGGASLLCVRRARTSLAKVRAMADSLRDHDQNLRGLVIWSLEDPLAPLPRAPALTDQESRGQPAVERGIRAPDHTGYSSMGR